MISNKVVMAAKIHLSQLAFPDDWLDRGDIEKAFRSLSDQPIPDEIRNPAGEHFREFLEYAAFERLREWTKPPALEI